MPASVTNATASVTHPAASVTQTAAFVTKAAAFNCSVFRKIAVFETRKQRLNHGESNTCENSPHKEGGAPGTVESAPTVFAGVEYASKEVRKQDQTIWSKLTSIAAERTVQGTNAEY